MRLSLVYWFHRKNQCPTPAQAKRLLQLYGVIFSVWIVQCHDEGFDERSRLCASCEEEHESYGWMLVQSLTVFKGLLFRSQNLW